MKCPLNTVIIGGFFLAVDSAKFVTIVCWTLWIFFSFGHVLYSSLLIGLLDHSILFNRQRRKNAKRFPDDEEKKIWFIKYTIGLPNPIEQMHIMGDN